MERSNKQTKQKTDKRNLTGTRYNGLYKEPLLERVPCQAGDINKDRDFMRWSIEKGWKSVTRVFKRAFSKFYQKDRTKKDAVFLL